MKRRQKTYKKIVVLLMLFIASTISAFFVMKFLQEKGEGKVHNETRYDEKKSTIKLTKKTSVTPEEKSSSRSSTVPSIPSESALDAIIDGQAASMHSLNDSELLTNANQVSYGIFYFDDETYISNHNSKPMISASVIKVFIMDYIYENNLNLETTLNGETLSELSRRMIQISDNEATNAIIEHIGMDNLNRYFSQSGYLDTRLKRKMLDYQAINQGLENYTSLDDCMVVLKKIYRNRASYPYSKMLDVLSGQQIETKLGRKMPGDVTVANKTGELDCVENDIGLILSSGGDMAVVVLSNDVSDSGAMRESIANFALDALNMKK